MDWKGFGKYPTFKILGLTCRVSSITVFQEKKITTIYVFWFWMNRLCESFVGENCFYYENGNGDILKINCILFGRTRQVCVHDTVFGPSFEFHVFDKHTCYGVLIRVRSQSLTIRLLLAAGKDTCLGAIIPDPGY